MPLHPNMELNDYLDILRRRKWFIIFSFLVVMFGAIVYNVLAPELYKSSTTVLLLPQRVPEGYVRSTVSIRFEERLTTIQQQVMSRTRLTTVMDDLGLYRAERKKVPPEVLIERMRKRIQVKVDSARLGEGSFAFTITFVHEDPQMAMLTASRLASFYIDENLKAREHQVTGTSEFLQSQLQDTKVKREAQEEKVKNYKLRFMGELPQQLQANLQTLSRLQDQLKSNSDAIRSAQDRKLFIEAQIQSMEAQATAIENQKAAKLGTGEAGNETSVDPYDPAAPLSAELNAKKNQLAAMSSKYTNQHPEIRRLRDEIARLESRVEETRKAESAGAGAEGSPVNRKPAESGMSGTSASPWSREREEIRRLRNQITAVDLEIKSLIVEREQLQKNISTVDARVEKSPRREQEMIALTRDYDNLKNQYDDMLKKKLNAEVAQNLEIRQKGEQFQVLDPANLPNRPFTPDRPMIFGIALVLALLAGVGGPFGLESLNPTLRGTSDFRNFFDMHILGSIPTTTTCRAARSASR